MAEGRDRRRGLNDADLVVHGHNGDQGGFLVQGVGKLIQVGQAVAPDRQNRQAKAFTLKALHGFQDAFVFGLQRNHVILAAVFAGKVRRPLDRQVVRLRRAGGKDDLPGVGADQGRHFPPRRFDILGDGAPGGMLDAMGICELLGEIGRHHRKGARVHRGGRLIVQIDRQAGLILPIGAFHPGHGLPQAAAWRRRNPATPLQSAASPPHRYPSPG